MPILVGLPSAEELVGLKPEITVFTSERPLFVRVVFIFTILSCIILTLGACRSAYSPGPFASGYSHHHNAQKTPSTANPWNIGYKYDAQKNADIVKEWKQAAHDLVNLLAADIDPIGHEVFLASPHLDNAFNHSFDHAMRGALRTHGYDLLNTPRSDAAVVIADIHDPAFNSTMRGYAYDRAWKNAQHPPQKTYKDLMITASVQRGSELQKTHRIAKRLPLYGYEEWRVYSPLTQGLFEVWR